MMENGSSGGARPLQPSESHEEFLELCALATTDALSGDERERLNRHLVGCIECRETLAQYQALIGAGVPAAALDETEPAARGSDSGWSLEDAEARLLGRLDGSEYAAGTRLLNPESVVSSDRAGTSEDASRGMDTLWRHMWLQAAAALLLVVALGYSAYRIGTERGARAQEMVPKAPVPSKKFSGETPNMEVDANLARSEAALRTARADLAALNARVRRQAAEVADLEMQNMQARRDLGSAAAMQASLEQARDSLAQQLATAQADLAENRQRLAEISAVDARNALEVSALRQQIVDLNNSIAGRDQDLTRAKALLDHDRDIRNLMGSRNLYIAEVYDVAGNGQTKKPFGRVFYTQGKSLIFYAYDLDQQPGVRDSSTFQAWGSRGPDRSAAVSLGMFYQDKTANKCWVLRAENRKALSGLDAVFVTVEPRGGSSHPSGKPLLYAYLHIEPNHP